MAEFFYKAINTKGEPVRGRISAENQNDIDAQLREIGYVLISCKNISEKNPRLTAHLFKKRIPSRDLIQMFVQLNQLQRAGVPLLDSLEHVRTSTGSQELHDVIFQVRREVLEGKQLSEAMSGYPRTFGRIVLALIGMGETSGRFDASFTEIIRQLKWDERMRARVKKATLYPKTLLVVLMLTLWVLMGAVVPKITEFLLGSALPASTKSLVAASQFFAHYFGYIAGAVLAAYLLLRIGRKLSRSALYATDYILLRLPVIGPVAQKMALSRFCRMFACMFASGIGLMQCLETSRGTVGNESLSRAMEIIQMRVQEGQGLAQAMQGAGEFPPLVVQMVKVGEESGKLPETLKEISEFFDNDVDEAVDKMIALIEPSITAVLAIVVLWIAAGVFGPVYNSFSELNL